MRVENGEEEVEDGEKSLVFHRGISTIAKITSIQILVFFMLQTYTTWN